MRSVVSNYPMVAVPEMSAEIASKVQAVVVEKLKGRHLEVHSVALADIELAKIVLEAVENASKRRSRKKGTKGIRTRHCGEGSGDRQAACARRG